jgi:hypothetical protein
MARCLLWRKRGKNGHLLQKNASPNFHDNISGKAMRLVVADNQVTPEASIHTIRKGVARRASSTTDLLREKLEVSSN